MLKLVDEIEVRAACEQMGLSTKTVYNWRWEDGLKCGKSRGVQLGETAEQSVEHLRDGDNPKFCVTAKSGANRVKFIMGGRRVKRLPPC